MRTIIYYKVYDPDVPFNAAFSDEEDARAAAVGSGFYGADAGVSKQTLKIYDSVDEWQRDTHRGPYKLPSLDDVLSKLSSDEKETLFKNGLRKE